jgi:predicted nucleic acid-binding Zn ribbon protein
MSQASTPGAALAAMRPTRAYRCQVCGATFTAKDRRAKYCSERCKQAAKYRRAKTARPTPATPPSAGG